VSDSHLYVGEEMRLLKWPLRFVPQPIRRGECLSPAGFLPSAASAASPSPYVIRRCRVPVMIRSKIVATMAPASSDMESLRQRFEAGTMEWRISSFPPSRPI
jgi:hypothetical protein